MSPEHPPELDLPPPAVQWLNGLDQPADGTGPVLPDDAEAERLLTLLDIDAPDRAEVLAARPDPRKHPAHWWILERVHHHTTSTVGTCVSSDGFRGWPALTSGADPVSRHLYVWAYLAALPAVRRHHAERQIADDVAWESLSLALALRAHREATGHSGLGMVGQWGPPIRLRGVYYRLGRLEYNRAEIALGNGPCGYAISVHIPATGRLDPAAVDSSIAAARAFFVRHYPEEPPAFFTCASWLMDPQLADYLPAESNLLRFQRRFELLPRIPERDHANGDLAILRFVFHQPDHVAAITDELLETLPQESTLQRAYVQHLRAGRHWDTRTGWMPFH